MAPNDPVSEFESEADEPETQIPVDISYRIIKQVSAQLYTNPRRAVEELVCNSYDAGATECYVDAPSSAEEELIVLDNGESMDLDGLEWLWTVARSPKERGGEGEERIDNNRKQIGKFGVGKLAAYALGDTLTHIATRDGTTRIISVDEDSIHRAEAEGRDKPKFPVHKLPSDKAREILEPYFDSLPNPWDRGWETWTAAMVGEIEPENTGQTLSPQYLNQMIRTSIPLSTQFIVYLNNSEITPREPPDDDVVTINVTDEEFIDRLMIDLMSFWKKRKDLDNEENVDSELYTCSVGDMKDFDNVDETVPALEIPKLGPVSGVATIFESTLSSTKREERGFEDNGFRVTVQGKLLNRHEPLFGVSQRSHKYWNRFLAEVEVPGLDDAILVQRNDVNENKIETLLTRRLLKTLFNFTRGEAEVILDSEEYEPKSFGERLNLMSPFGAPEAIGGLSEGLPTEDIDDIDLKPVTLNQDDPPVKFDADEGVIYVNEEHPLFQALSEERGFGKFRKTFGEVMAGNLLTSGYYRSQGVERPLIEGGEEIFDDVLRSAASYFRDETEFLIEEIQDASFETDKAFEKALVAAFRNMKLASRRYGQSEFPDGVIEVRRAGKPNFHTTIEAKGKKNKGAKVDHEDASPSKVKRHRDEMEIEGKEGCNWAVIIARDFQEKGSAGNEKSAFLREIDQVREEDMESDAEKGIGLLTLDAVNKMLRLHRERRFTHQEFIKILKNEKHPSEIEEYIEKLWENLPDTDLMEIILRSGWEIQGNSEMRPSAGALTTEERVQSMVKDLDQVREIIRVLGVITGGKIHVYDDGNEFEIRAHPDSIIEEISEMTREGEGSDLTDLS